MNLPTQEEMESAANQVKDANSSASVLLSSAYTQLSNSYLYFKDDPGPLGPEIEKFEELFVEFLTKHIEHHGHAMAAGLVAISVAITLAKTNARDLEKYTPTLSRILDSRITGGSDTVN